MAKFDADVVRMVALELQARALGLYARVLSIVTCSSAWTLNGTDPLLPLPFDVRVGLEQYRALRLERMRLDDLVESLLTAQVGDTLSYPPPVAGSGLITYNENLIFTEALMYGL
jgi:hypothetical protein